MTRFALLFDRESIGHNAQPLSTPLSSWRLRPCTAHCKRRDQTFVMIFSLSIGPRALLPRPTLGSTGLIPVCDSDWHFWRHSKTPVSSSCSARRKSSQSWSLTLCGIFPCTVNATDATKRNEALSSEETRRRGPFLESTEAQMQHCFRSSSPPAWIPPALLAEMHANKRTTGTPGNESFTADDELGHFNPVRPD